MPFTWPVSKLQDNKSTKSKQDVQAVAVFLEHLLWDADVRHPRGFAVTSSPGDAFAQNGPELIIKLDPITKSTACLPVDICSVLQEPARTPLVCHHNPRLFFPQVLVTLAQSFSTFPLVRAKAA